MNGPFDIMGQSQSLTAPCCATRERLNSDFKVSGSTSPLLTVSSLKYKTGESTDEWADDVEAGSPSLAEAETAPESECQLASGTVQTEPSGGCCAEETDRCCQRRLVTFQADEPPTTAPQMAALRQKPATPRFPESPSHDGIQSSLRSDGGPLRLHGMFSSSQVSQDHRKYRSQTQSEPPIRVRDGSSESIMVCRHGCCRAFRPDGVAKTDRLVHIIRRERQTHKRVLDFLAEHGFKGVNDSRRQSLGYPRWFPLHAAVSQYDAEMVRMLLRMGADPSRRNGNGLTAGELSLRQTKKGERRAFDVLAALEAHDLRSSRFREGVCSVADVVQGR